MQSSNGARPGVKKRILANESSDVLMKMNGGAGNGRNFLKVEMDFGESIGMATEHLRVNRVNDGGQASERGVVVGMRVVAVGGYVVKSEKQLQLAVQECRRALKIATTVGGTIKDCNVLFFQEGTHEDSAHVLI